MCVKKNVKSFPSLTAHRAALISVSQGPQPDTSFYTARPQIRGQCIAVCLYNASQCNRKRHTVRARPKCLTEEKRFYTMLEQS